jgi:DNA (cytosine-5)-methyltransferase 1
VTFGSLFSGIGGMDLGLERAGMVCKWQVEIDEYCRKVLTKHWPNIPKYGDIRELSGSELERVDLIAGGFPCQDISIAGPRTGITGKRSGLWDEFRRILGVLRPHFALVENVARLSTSGLGRVLGDIAELDFDAEVETIPACAFGAPHPRSRLFIFAHPHGLGWSARQYIVSLDEICTRREWEAAKSKSNWKDMERWLKSRFPISDGAVNTAGLRRGSNGIPHRMDRLRSLGNAVVPQVAEWIGKRIIESCGV